jgi:hypothetical protein
MVVGKGQQGDGVADADVFGALAGGGEKDLGRRAVGVLLEEVMLDRPDVVVAQPVSEFDLFQGLLDQLALTIGLPGTGILQFIKAAQFHSKPPTTDGGLQRGTNPLNGRLA